MMMRQTKALVIDLVRRQEAAYAGAQRYKHVIPRMRVRIRRSEILYFFRISYVCTKCVIPFTI